MILNQGNRNYLSTIRDTEELLPILPVRVFFQDRTALRAFKTHQDNCLFEIDFHAYAIQDMEKDANLMQTSVEVCSV